MTAELMTAIAVTPTAVATGVALGLIWWASRRDRQRPAVAAETPLPPARMDLRDPCPLCGGLHCAGCTEPARAMSTAYDHRPRHDFAEIPPSLLWLAGQVHVTFRGALIASQLAGRYVWRPAGGDGTRFQLWAAAKLGRPIQVGQPRLAGWLP